MQNKTNYELLLEAYIKDLEYQILVLEGMQRLRKAMDDWDEQQKKVVQPPQQFPWINTNPLVSRCATCGADMANNYVCSNPRCPLMNRFVD